MWFQKVVQAFKIKELRNKILFILFIFAIVRLMSNIPMPGINAQDLKLFFENPNNQFFGLMNLFTGGALDRFSIVMLGLGPYITASIILQLLGMIFPQIEKMYKEGGEQGRAKFQQWGRIMTAPLAFLQSYAMMALFYRQGVISTLSFSSIFPSLITVTAGTMILMWLGELISEKGIGNGVSLLIFAGIVADFPNNVAGLISTWNPNQLPLYLLFLGIVLFVVSGVVLIEEGRRNIPVSYAKRVRGMKMYGGVSTYLPLNINPAGVMPIIFAVSILLLPAMIGNFLGAAGGVIGDTARRVAEIFANQWIYGGMYFTLVVLFTYFYTSITFDPKEISTNLQKMGGFIPGIRPGTSTVNFLNYVLTRTLLVGAVALGFVAVLPTIVQNLTNIRVFTFFAGGTALMIVVSVTLEVMRQVRAQLEMREYDNF